MSQLFSERYNLIPPKQNKEYIYDRIPANMKEGLIALLEHYVNYNDDFPTGEMLWQNWRKYLKKMPSRSPVGFEISQAIIQCKWYEVLDLCEVTYKTCSLMENREIKEVLASELNNLLETTSMGYRMKEGCIEPIRASAVYKEIEKAKLLLKEPEFEGPEEQFEKALHFLNQRPKPDVENCIKDAVGAVEAVARIVTGHKSNLNKIAQDIAQEGIIIKPVDQIFDKVYACRGSLGAHGQTTKSVISAEEAELILSICASMIIYLAKKYNRQVV